MDFLLSDFVPSGGLRFDHDIQNGDQFSHRSNQRGAFANAGLDSLSPKRYTYQIPIKSHLPTLTRHGT